VSFEQTKPRAVFIAGSESAKHWLEARLAELAHSACFEMFSRTPTHPSITNNEDPP
jgi:hypothetical protein